MVRRWLAVVGATAAGLACLLRSDLALAECRKQTKP